MKNKKLNLEDFKENQLVKKQLMSIAGGEGEEWVYDPRTNTLNYIYLTGPNNGGSGSGDGDGKINTP
jgi:hypothetical protein